MVRKNTYHNYNLDQMFAFRYYVQCVGHWSNCKFLYWLSPQCNFRLALITWLKQQRLDWYLRHPIVVSLPHYFPESRKTSPVVVVSTTLTLFSLRHSYTHLITHPRYLWSFDTTSYYISLGPLPCECTFSIAVTCDNHSATLWAASSGYLFTGLVAWTNGEDWYWQSV